VLLAALSLGAAGAGSRELATTTTVRVQVVGQGEIVDDKNQLDCGAGHTTCRVSYTGTGTVTFSEGTGTPSDWTFDGLSGCGDPCALTLDQADADHEIVATFVPNQNQTSTTLTVTVNGDAQGSGGAVSGDRIDCATGSTADCQDEVPAGSTLTIVETPADGFLFGGWGGACAGTAVSCTLTMSESRSATATFRKPQLTVTVKGNGTVTGSGIACTSGSGTCMADETAGGEVILTATPPPGGSFTGWSGACSGSGSTCTVSMTTDRTVTANFSGGTPSATTFPLSVSVSGSGTVAGAGLNCGTAGTACSVNLAAGTSVTLTATPAAGASFQSWGGACSGTARTCSLTMSTARSVSASFSGGSATTVALTVAVTGKGSVTGGGIECGNGKTACTANVEKGSTVGLTARPAAGARFAGWGGACSGTAPSCTLEMSDARQVSATFGSGAGGGGAGAPAAGATLRKLAPPAVKKTPSGYQITLRFRAGASGRARMRALLAGRVQTTLSFTAGVGIATVGPFPVASPGFYEFDLQVGTQTIRWTACLGRCGEHASSLPFTLTRGMPDAAHAGALWSLTLHFRSSQAAGVVVRVYRSKRLARELRFPIRAGAVTPGALLLSPGTYRIALTATDSVGRVRTLSWYALFP
jgi:Divergent InlB B-repeat domain